MSAVLPSWRQVAYAAAVVVTTTVLVVAGSDVQEPTPAEAWFFLDTQSGEYLSPPCAAALGIDPVEKGFGLTTWGRLQGAGLRSNDACREIDGYSGAETWTPWYLLAKAGIAPRPRSRWDETGDWRW